MEKGDLGDPTDPKILHDAVRSLNQSSIEKRIQIVCFQWWIVRSKSNG